MAQVRCRACGGTYDTVQRDGSDYRHVCPLLTVRELRALFDDGALVLSIEDAARLEAAKARDEKYPPADGDVSQLDSALADLVVLRDGHRNENPDIRAAVAAEHERISAVVRDRAGSAQVTTLDVSPIAAGAGVDVLRSDVDDPPAAADAL